MKPFTFIFFLSIITQFTNNRLINHGELCQNFKHSMFKTINIYKEMKDKQKKDLFTYSLRHLTRELLMQAKFDTQEEIAERTNILTENAKAMAWFAEYKNFDLNTLLKSQMELEKIADQAINKVHKKTVELNTQKHILKSYADSLKTIRTNLKKTNFNGMYKFYRKLVIVFQGLDNEVFIKEHVHWTLNSFETMIKSLEPGQVVSITEDKMLVDAYFEAKENIDVLNSVQKIGAIDKLDDFSNYHKMTTDEFKKKKKLFKKMISKYKDYTEVHLKTFKDILHQSDNYKNFIKIMKKGMKILPKITKLKSEILFMQKEMEHKKFQSKIEFLKNIRIHRSDYLELETGLTKVKNFKKTLKMKEDGQTDLNELSTKLAKAFIHSGKKEIREIQSMYEEKSVQWDQMNNLKDTERVLDIYFGKIVAMLQGSNSPENFSQCFTVMEFSLMLYYAVIFQMISSKTAFLTSFFSLVPAYQKSTIISQLFYDLEEEKLIDPKIINIYTNELSGKGEKKAIKRYAMIMDNEMDEIFKKFMSDKEMVKGKVATVLRYAGISAKVIGSQLLKRGVLWIFIALTTAVAVLLGIVTIAAIITAVIIGLVIYLLRIAFRAIAKYLHENPMIKYQFVSGLSNFIAKFRKKSFEGLDFRKILNYYEQNKKQEISAFFDNHTKKKKMKDRIDIFKNIFFELIDMDQYLETPIVFEVFDQHI